MSYDRLEPNCLTARPSRLVKEINAFAAVLLYTNMHDEGNILFVSGDELFQPIGEETGPRLVKSANRKRKSQSQR